MSHGPLARCRCGLSMHCCPVVTFNMLETLHSPDEKYWNMKFPMKPPCIQQWHMQFIHCISVAGGDCTSDQMLDLLEFQTLTQCNTGSLDDFKCCNVHAQAFCYCFCWLHLLCALPVSGFLTFLRLHICCIKYAKNASENRKICMHL